MTKKTRDTPLANTRWWAVSALIHFSLIHIECMFPVGANLQGEHERITILYERSYFD